MLYLALRLYIYDNKFTQSHALLYKEFCRSKGNLWLVTLIPAFGHHSSDFSQLQFQKGKLHPTMLLHDFGRCLVVQPGTHQFISNY